MSRQNQRVYHEISTSYQAVHVKAVSKNKNSVSSFCVACEACKQLLKNMRNSIKNDLEFQIRRYRLRATCFDIILTEAVSRDLDVKASRPRSETRSHS